MHLCRSDSSFNSCCSHLFVCHNPKLGAEGMRPLQHTVCDTFSISKTVLHNNKVFITYIVLILQKDAGFLQEHVYMAGDHAVKGMWL